MAIYHLHTEPASRSNGKNAVAMAAYRCGGRLMDDRTGEIKDYSRKQGIIETALFFPPGVEFDRQYLWNMAEQAEKRKDSRIAREIRIALPHELEPEARSRLVNDFARHLVDRYGIAIDASIHDPDRQGDNRNYHAHLLMTTRQISQDGLGEKADLERSDKALKNEGKTSTIQQLKEIRSEWEHLSNMALERQGREERISAKSYEARGIDQEPTIHIGPDAMAMERRGIRTRKVTLNNAIRKRNLRRILLKRMGKVRREIEAAERRILDLEREMERVDLEQDREMKSESVPAKPMEGLEKPPLTATELIDRHSQPKTLEENAEVKRKPRVEELLTRNARTDKKISISRELDSWDR